MNYYVDFDGTLYNTQLLKEQMLVCLAKSVHSQNKKLKSGDLLAEAVSLFCREKIYDIFDLCEYFAKKYNVQNQVLKSNINDLLKNGKKFVFKDSVKFLDKLKKEGHTIVLLTYCAQKTTKFQERKVAGSGLVDYFDKIIITQEPKYQLKNIDYKNGIFIDDNPNDLLGLSKNNPIELVRIKREDNKYSKMPLEDVQVKEIETFKELSL